MSAAMPCTCGPNEGCTSCGKTAGVDVFRGLDRNEQLPPPPSWMDDDGNIDWKAVAEIDAAEHADELNDKRDCGCTLGPCAACRSNRHIECAQDHECWGHPRYLKPEDCDELGYCVHCGTATVHRRDCVVQKGNDGNEP